MHAFIIPFAGAVSLLAAPALAAPVEPLAPVFSISNTTAFQETEWASLTAYMQEHPEAINYRRDVSYEGNKMPGCETDPTWSKQKSGWKHGDGKYIIWDCKTGYKKEDQC
jgi:hypothetical protein